MGDLGGQPEGLLRIHGPRELLSRNCRTGTTHDLIVMIGIEPIVLSMLGIM